MKKMSFEVVISPSDVLGAEMNEVLGGLSTTMPSCTKCKRSHCNCDDKGKSEEESEINPGYAPVNNTFIEID